MPGETHPSRAPSHRDLLRPGFSDRPGGRPSGSRPSVADRRLGGAHVAFRHRTEEGCLSVLARSRTRRTRRTQCWAPGRAEYILTIVTIVQDPIEKRILMQRDTTTINYTHQPGSGHHLDWPCAAYQRKSWICVRNRVKKTKKNKTYSL